MLEHDPIRFLLRHYDDTMTNKQHEKELHVLPIFLKYLSSLFIDLKIMEKNKPVKNPKKLF